MGETNVPLIVEIINNGARSDSVSLQLTANLGDITIHNQHHFLGQMLCGEHRMDTFLLDISNNATQGNTATFNLNIIAENGYETSSSFDIIIGGKAWTIMILINGDNNLTSYGVKDIDEMETTGSNDYMNILVQFDGETSYTDSAGSHTDANRYYITHHTTSNSMIDAYPLMNLGEVDMGDTSVIFDFFKWGVDNYPARHYLFVIWDHGSGWVKEQTEKGVSHDDTDGDYLSFANGEFRVLVRKMKNYLGRNVDIIGYDVCVTQMIENLYEAYGYADNIVASEKSEPGDGWDYHFLSTIASNPDITPEALASEIVNYYAQYYSSQSDVTLSAVRLNTSLLALVGFTNDLARELIKAGGISKQTIQNIINNLNGEVETGDPYGYFVDVKHFVTLIKSADINNNINAICDSIIALYDSNAFSINSWASSDVISTMSGISVMLPPAGEDLSGWDGPYNGLLMAKNTLWYRFLTGDTILPSEPHTTLSRGYFNIQGKITDTVPDNANGTLNLILTNYTLTADSNATIILKAPSFMSLSQDTILINEVPRDTQILRTISFTTSSNVPDAGYSIKVTMNTNQHEDDYQISFINAPLTDIAEKPRQRSARSPIPTILKKNSTLTYNMQINRATTIHINLFDISGRKAKNIFNGRASKGYYTFDLKMDLREGVYFLKVNRNNEAETYKILIVE